MTRINSGIMPAHLTDQHLMAEYREMVRIPNAVARQHLEGRDVLRAVPDTYRLGTGHVRYFYDKIRHLHRRFNDIREELLDRGYSLNMDDDMFRIFSENPEMRLLYYHDGVDDMLAASVVKPRIIERVSPAHTMRGRRVDPIEYRAMMDAIY